MSVGSGHAKLKRAARDLTSEWREVNRYWRDEVSRRFEKEHLEPILAKLRSAVEAMGHMDAVVNQARRDCE